MTHTITYSTLHEYDAGAPGITVPVQLIVGSAHANVTAKLDCGAGCCIFRRGYGLALGLDVERGQPQWISTITGSFLTFGHEITMLALGYEIDTTVYFAKDESFTRDVLGRLGWMQQFMIGIVDYEGKLFLSRYTAP